LLESLSSTTLFEYPIVFLDRYYYNYDGDLSGIESFNIDGGEEYPASRESFWYVDHLLQSFIAEVSDDLNGWVAESKMEYSYTGFRKEELVKSFVMDFEVSDWKLNHTLGYVYDNQERVVQNEEVFATEVGGWERQLNTYAYFIGEHLASESSYTYDDQTEVWILQDKKHYYYNELTAYDPIDPRQTEDLKMWPNPTSGYVQFQLNGGVLLQVFGSAGQVVRQFDLKNSERILNLTVLPSGSYYVKAKSDDGYYAGMISIQ
jgi:hypothetical protein